jgi:NAD(P)-dependent dehydrogenase (short-subunit alcohol dehydrogenase family)
MDGIDLSGQVGLVTGSGTGIGQGIAVGLARRGAVVVIADVEARRAEHTAKLIRDAGGEAFPLTTDVMDTVQIEAAVRATDELYGRLDILVNNAGGVRGRRFLEQSERSWRRHIGINLTSMLATTWHSAHIMVREGPRGSHRERGEHRGQPCRADVRGVRGVQGRHGQLHPGDGCGTGRARHPDELHSTGPDAYTRPLRGAHRPCRPGSAAGAPLT